ncbi:hypothetical protein [Halobaculum sp. P14]|uniref:hypothetical protein n=1 Tax=Halobaculum sp. P14 TaxID=3421638 RepID=UPI003EBD1AB2
MYSKSTGENHPEDVSPRPICNYHYLFNTAATSRWLPASVGAAGLVAALKNAPAADASLLTAAVITAAWFVAGGLGALAAVAGVLLAFHGLVVWTGGEAA